MFKKFLALLMLVCSFAVAAPISDFNLKYLELWDTNVNSYQLRTKIPEGFFFVKTVSNDLLIYHEYVEPDAKSILVPKNVIKICNLKSILTLPDAVATLKGSLKDSFEKIYSVETHEGIDGNIPYTTMEIYAKGKLILGEKEIPVDQLVIDKFIQSKNGILIISYVSLYNNTTTPKEKEKLKKAALKFFKESEIVQKGK